MQRIKRGWGLTKKSWALLNGHRELIRFPLYGGFRDDPAGDRLLRSRPLLLRPKTAWRRDPAARDRHLRAQRRRLLLQRRPRRRRRHDLPRRADATVADGLAVARSRFSQICGWAAISTAISVLMGLLENQGGTSATSPRRLVGMAWALVTFLAVPVIAIEGTGPLDTLKRSGSIFRNVGPADHRQHRDRRRDLPDRHPAGGDPDRRRDPALVLRLFIGALLV